MDDLVDDGFGTQASAICPICGCRAVYVCRPGDIRCAVCYDGKNKELKMGEIKIPTEYLTPKLRKRKKQIELIEDALKELTDARCPYCQSYIGVDKYIDRSAIENWLLKRGQ